MSTKKTNGINIDDLSVSAFSDEQVEVTVSSLAPDKTKVELILVCVNEISDGARNRYRKLMRKYASHFQKLTDEAQTDDEREEINDQFSDIMRRCDATSRVVDWKGVDQKFDSHVLYSAIARNVHWVESILFQTSVKKIGLSS